jgi:hypothetical protein
MCLFSIVPNKNCFPGALHTTCLRGSSGLERTVRNATGEEGQAHKGIQCDPEEMKNSTVFRRGAERFFERGKIVLVATLPKFGATLPKFTEDQGQVIQPSHRRIREKPLQAWLWLCH